MAEHDWLAARFEEHRGALRAVAYRMLGSTSEADDAVQEAWLRLGRADAGDVANLRGWFTTIVSRICLDMLRARASRREQALGIHVPDPVVEPAQAPHAEHALLQAEAVGLAMLVVLEQLDPAERVAFVLHDLFAIPFDEIATIVDRSPAAARQLASRARRRVRGAPVTPDGDAARQRQVVDAFLAASQEGDFDRLLGVLAPDVVLRLDRGAQAVASKEVRGAAEVAKLGFRFSGDGWAAHVVRVNGAPGLVVARGSTPYSVIGFTVRDGRIATIDILADVARVSRIALGFLFSADEPSRT